MVEEFKGEDEFQGWLASEILEFSQDFYTVECPVTHEKRIMSPQYKSLCIVANIGVSFVKATCNRIESFLFDFLNKGRLKKYDKICKGKFYMVDLWDSCEKYFTFRKVDNLFLSPCLSDWEEWEMGEPVAVISLNITPFIKMILVYEDTRCTGIVKAEKKIATQIERIKGFDGVHAHMESILPAAAPDPYNELAEQYPYVPVVWGGLTQYSSSKEYMYEDGYPYKMIYSPKGQYVELIPCIKNDWDCHYVYNLFLADSLMMMGFDPQYYTIKPTYLEFLYNIPKAKLLNGDLLWDIYCGEFAKNTHLEHP